ncbi:DedA family protein [Paenibacillus tundrae]|uniref:Membrane protein DedA with SNARE-associated domain n=1 Tax=Paenibacillus tundrae TaxID=528187 RepID=A0ABT9WIC2_9BACL|nr:DedA family protein [Paenibacillus tundrae]MDQ0173035.1 membrane protein DedA with SNARE-associated domain [Paenibacillus tundrae]
MELLEKIQHLFGSYGYSVLFFGLLLEFIALPFPGETTMAYAGYLSYKGQLDFGFLLILAFLGTTIGMTITYFIGVKAGLPFITRYGKWFLLKQDKLDKTQKWFGKYGNGLIFIGYFIPGVRHFTGYFAGIAAIPFRKFALYAYSGALFWVVLFLGIGKVFGPQWNVVFQLAHKYSAYLLAGVGLLLLIAVIYRYRTVWSQRNVKKKAPVPQRQKQNAD